MLERIMDALQTPVQTTINNSTVRAYMGSGVSAIPVYINSMPSGTNPPPCWVIFKPLEPDLMTQQFLGGATVRAFADTVQFRAECYSLGDTSKTAEDRAAQLLLEVERQIRLTLEGSGLSSLARASLIAPTTTYEKPNWALTKMPPKQPPTMGPNSDSQYTAQRYCIVEVNKTTALGN